MNDDEFEAKLRALTAKLVRPDPTAAWKAEILARARTDAETRTPRWLMLGLGLLWVCIAVLRFTTPDNAGSYGAAAHAETQAGTSPDFHPVSDTPLRGLIALHANPQFPDHP